MDYSSDLHEPRTNAEQSETRADLRTSFESDPHGIGARLFASYADKYADWVARGKPPSPSQPTKWVWPHGRSVRSRALIYRIADVQWGCCSLCGQRLRFDELGNNRLLPTFDHVVPRSMGGKNSGNRLVAHRHCNQRKASAPPTGCELILLAAVNARLYGR